MKEIIKKSYPHIIAILIFIVLSAVYFAPQLKGYLIKQSDIEQHIGMSKEINDFREKYHKEPLWTNSAFAGMPAYQISTNNSNLVNTVKNLILRVIPRPIGYIFIMMAGFYILLLCFNVDPGLAIIGSIAFGLASFNMLYLGNGHNAKVHAISFIPPLIGGIIYSYRKNIYIGAILTSIFTCLHLSANHLQITYYLMFLLFAIIVVEFYRFAKEKAIPKFLKISGILLVAGMLGVLPTISNLILTKEYSKHTTRGKSELTISSDKQKTKNNEALDPEYIKRYNLGHGETWSLVIPNVKGGKSGYIGQYKNVVNAVDARYRQNVAQFMSYWGEQYSTGGTYYYGAAVFLLFVLSIFFIKDRIKWAFLAVSFLAILLSWKNGLVVDFFIEHFPMFNKFRDTKMMLYIVQISFPLMSVLFLKSFLKKEVDKKKLIYVTLSVSGLFFLFYLIPTIWFDFLTKTEAQYFDQQMLNVKNNTAYLSQWEGLKTELVNARILIFKKDCLRSLFFVLVIGVLLLLFMFRTIKENSLLALLGIFILIDLWGVDKRYLNNEKKGSQYLHWEDAYDYRNPYKPTVADIAILENELKVDPELNTVLKQEVGKMKNMQKLKPKEFEIEKIKVYFRELNFGTDYRVLSLTSPLTMSSRDCYFHKTLVGYHGAKLRRFDELIGIWISKEYSNLTDFSKTLPVVDSILVLPDIKTSVLNMLNTKYIIYNFSKPPAINPYRFGNAWFVKNIDFVDSADEEMLALGSISKDNVVIQEKYKENLNGDYTYNPNARINLTLYRPNHLVYESEANSDQVAVFSEIYYEDGWNTYIDGRKADYVKANFLLRAMNVPKGKHVVEFKFEPKSYYLSRKISRAGSGLIIIFISILLFFNWKYKTE